MKYDPSKHHRKSIRLKDYDYSSEGLYFITFCVQNMAHLFGEVENKEMILNDAGKMVEEQWKKLPERFPQIELHEFRVMPNHFHGILEIKPPPLVRATLVVAPASSNDTSDPPSSEAIAPAQSEAITALPDAKENGGLSANENTEGAPTRGDEAELSVGEKNGLTRHTLGEMMGAFKSITTVEYINGVKELRWQPFKGKLWKRDYWEHIIKHSRAYDKISDYIVNNSLKWREDKFYTK